MKRTESPTKKKKNKPGPKTSCTPQVCEQAYRLALLGLTNREMAVAFDKDKTTIEYWYRNYPRFKDAIDQGRVFADGKVSEALYQRALGYSHPSVKFFKTTVTEKEYDEEGNVVKERSYDKIIEQPYTKHYPPDTKAAIKWLGVRNRETWGESIKVDHRHQHRHLHAANININHVLDQISDGSQFTEAELKTAAKLGLNKAAQEMIEAQQN